MENPMNDDKMDLFEQYMRLSRVYYISVIEMEQKGATIGEAENALKLLGLAYCKLFEEMTGFKVWDLKGTGYAEDLEKLTPTGGDDGKDS